MKIVNFAYRDLQTWVEVIDFGTNRKYMYTFLLVINSNFSPIVPHVRDMAA